MRNGLRRAFLGVFDRSGGAKKDVVKSICSSMPRDISFFAQKTCSTNSDLIAYLGIASAHQHIPLGYPSIPRQLNDFSDVSISTVLAGQGVSKMTLQCYPRQHTSSSVGVGIVIPENDNDISIACWTREYIVKKKVNLERAKELLSRLPESLEDPGAWDESIHLRPAFEQVCDAKPGEILAVKLTNDGKISLIRERSQGHPRVILPGSFNPLHIGHVRMLQSSVAKIYRGAKERMPLNLSLTPGGAFELTVPNPDKGNIHVDELLDRALQFAGRMDLYSSSCALFDEKSVLLPGTIWVVGIDTAQRMLMPRFYNDDPKGPERLLSEVSKNQGSFLVAGRGLGGHWTEGIEDLDIPSKYQSSEFQCLEEEEFRLDISSTQLRKLGFSL
mmetsp:Transcript_15742/g.21981  ORF Transcript_15742/g.21981 Transcript_15742/m.21981 type:complete len:387 (-) Transcript_15742:124-1284(-)